MLKPFVEPIKLGIAKVKDSAWRMAKEQAEEAAKLAMEDRVSIIVEHLPSDEEMDSEDEGGSISFM